jgi:hypothetical protein
VLFCGRSLLCGVFFCPPENFSHHTVGVYHFNGGGLGLPARGLGGHAGGARGLRAGGQVSAGYDPSQGQAGLRLIVGSSLLVIGCLGTSSAEEGDEKALRPCWRCTA